MWFRGRGKVSQIQQWMSDSEVKLLDAEHSHGSVSVSPWWSYVKQQLLSFIQNSFMFSPTRKSIKNIFDVCLFFYIVSEFEIEIKCVGNKCSSGDSRNTGGDIFPHLKKKLAPATALSSFMVRNIRCQMRPHPGRGPPSPTSACWLGMFSLSHCDLVFTSCPQRSNPRMDSKHSAVYLITIQMIPVLVWIRDFYFFF